MKIGFKTGLIALLLSNVSEAYSNVPDTVTVYKEAELAGVEVTSYKRIEQSDAKKSVYKLTAKMPKNTKADVALMGLPGLVNDNSGFRIAGRERSCRLLIDGQEASKSEIERLDASEIARVEIKHISVEGNQYDGEINVIRKRHHDTQLNGSVELGKGILREHTSLYPVLSFKTDRLELRAMASTMNYKQDNDIEMKRVPANGLPTSYASNGSITNRQDFAMFKASYFFSSHLSAYLQYLYFGLNSKQNSNIEGLDGTNHVNDTRMTIDNHSINGVLRYDLNSKSRLFLKGQAMLYRNTNSVEQLEDTYYSSKMRQYSIEAIHELDSMRILGGQHEFNYGFKGIFRSNIPHVYSALYNNVYMAYLNDWFNLSRSWSIYIQLKEELADYKLPASRISKWSFLPSVSVSYKLPKGSLSLIGERYVIRPSIDQLNPDVFYTNEVKKLYGNPDLKPQYNNVVTLKGSQQVNGAFLSLSASYRYATGLIDPVYSDDLNSSKYMNVGYGNVSTIAASYMQLFFGRRLNLNASASAKYYDYRISSGIEQLSQSSGNSGWGYSASLFISYMSTKKWFYTFRMVLDTHIHDINSVTKSHPNAWISISKSVFRDNLKLSLAYNNIFNYNRESIYNFRDASQTYTTDTKLSNITISATWNFGKKFRTRNIGTNINNDDITIKQP